MKDKIFFPIIGIIGFAIIAAALLPLQAKPAPDLVGRTSGKSIVILGEELNGFKRDNGFIITKFTGSSNLQLGPRFAAEIANPNTGLNLVFPENFRAKLPKNFININIKAVPLSKSEAKSMAVILYGNGQKQTIMADLPFKTEYNRFSFSINFIPEGIIINPALEGEAHGIELQAIVIN